MAMRVSVGFFTSAVAICTLSSAFAQVLQSEPYLGSISQQAFKYTAEEPSEKSYDPTSDLKATAPQLAAAVVSPHGRGASGYRHPDSTQLSGSGRASWKGNESSVYIPVDNWIYPAMLRLYSMGYLSTLYVSMRPWTRLSTLHMLQASQDDILAGDNEEAKDILAAVLAELSGESPEGRMRGLTYGPQSLYTRFMVINGPVLRDSYHLGQTLVNDYGRPYQSGFNNITGFSTLAEKGRYSFYLRAEYQHSPAATGYSSALATKLSTIDQIKPYVPQATIPEGTIPAQNPFRIVEGTLSLHLLGHEISGGKSDAWLGPGTGGALNWSNNAENIYSFRVNRVEPLQIPLVSRVLGPVRYDFFYGDLKGHAVLNSPYVHSEMFAFRPTENFEFGFQRTIIFGGKGHAPVTLHTFLKGFFDIHDTAGTEKDSRSDPGARFSDFNFSWRLPIIERFATLYVDSFTHDDVTPISAPRRAAYRPGLYLSQLPHLKNLDFRIEGATTDQPVTRSTNGLFTYWEGIQKQGYTNNGLIMGDWIGRQATGGQAWFTWHLSGNELIQLEYLRKKTAADFIPEGTTQNSVTLALVKRIRKEVEINSWVQYERWKAPIYLNGPNNNATITVQLTWFPKLHSIPPSP